MPSWKTDRLVALLPDVYGAADPTSLAYRLLDAAGAELVAADEAVKWLLKSHWVDYAEGAALDGLGAIFSVTRRTLRSGDPESDDEFRRRLRSIVPLFTGGGTKSAVVGAVRAALGLPFDVAQLKIRDPGLRAEIEALVTLDEFSPKMETVREDRVSEVAEAAQLVLVLDMPSVDPTPPRLQWTFQSGTARFLRLELRGSGVGVISRGQQLFQAGSTLVLSTDGGGPMRAVLDNVDISQEFTALGGGPPILPAVPLGRSEWEARAWDNLDRVQFDLGTYDLPRFQVELQRVRELPLTFDVHVPYFLKRTVEELAARYNYDGDVLVYEGLPPARIQEVVDQTLAAGVRGSVHFSLRFFEDHAQREELRRHAQSTVREDLRPSEKLVVGSLNELADRHQIRDAFIVGNVFDVSTFDTNYGFAE